MKHSLIQQYGGYHIDVIPLQAGEITPIEKGWHLMEIVQQWELGSDDSNVSIHWSGTSRLAIIDFDDKNRRGTFDKYEREKDFEI